MYANRRELFIVVVHLITIITYTIRSLYLWSCDDLVVMELVVLTSSGHVDAGKSTLMGHLLCLLGNVSKRAMHK